MDWELVGRSAAHAPAKTYITFYPSPQQYRWLPRLTFSGDLNIRVDSGFLFFSSLMNRRFSDICISLYSQFSYNQQPIWKINVAKWMTPTSVSIILTDIWIQINPKIRIRIRILFCFKFWRRRRFALSITFKTYLISKTPSLVRVYQCSVENGINDICCFSGVILSPYNCS